MRARVCMCLCVVWHIFTEGCACYPCLLESDLRLCLIGVFTLSGLTHTDTLDLGSLPFAMKRENSDTKTCLLLGCKEKNITSLSFSFLSLLSGLVCFKSLIFAIWTDELFNHGSVILETCIKVINVYLIALRLELFFILPTLVHVHYFCV